MPLISPTGPLPPPPADPRAVVRVKHWIREALGLDGGVGVMVRQLACREPGCPPIETVVAALHEGGTLSRTVHRPVADVTYDDVYAAFHDLEHFHD